VFLLTAFSGVAQAQLVPTEGAFFDDLPVVLTVSRLAQPLSDTPGAVTVLDRDAIRRSGARTLADLLRLVPGYVVSGYNGANPAAFYHAPLDEFGGRNLVQVDGRSLYTATFLGGTHRGMLTVQLDDIERIEVLRGSNSAAYGANALFGVINVVTRHSADTLGGFARVDAGEADIRDVAVRVGWGASDFTQRLTVAQRSDSGYKFVNDDSRPPICSGVATSNPTHRTSCNCRLATRTACWPMVLKGPATTPRVTRSGKGRTCAASGPGKARLWNSRAGR
jgi:iron complex outermembrane receptor protein